MSFTVSGSGGASGTPGNIVINNGADVEVKSTDGSVTVDDSESTAEKKVFDLSVQASAQGDAIFSDDFNYKIEEYQNPNDPNDPNNGKKELSKRYNAFVWGEGNTVNTLPLHTYKNESSSDCVYFPNSLIVGNHNSYHPFMSAIFGERNTLTGYNSYIFGTDNTLGPLNSFLFGDRNKFPEMRENYIILGMRNKETGGSSNPIILGDDNESFGGFNFSKCLGNYNKLRGTSCYVIGESHETSGTYNFCIGRNNKVSNVNDNLVFAIGYEDPNENTVSGSLILGVNPKTDRFVDRVPITLAIGSGRKTNFITGDGNGNLKLHNDIYIDMPDGIGNTEQVKLQDLLERLLNNGNGASGDTYGISTDPTIKCSTTSENGHTDFRIEIDRIQPSTLIDYYGTTYTMGDIISALRNLGALN